MTSLHAVIDCSVVVDLLVVADRAEVISALPPGAWHAPSFLDVEVVSAVRTRLLDLADNVTTYDATYVVLAQALDVPLLTRDRRLAAAAEGVVTVQVV